MWFGVVTLFPEVIQAYAQHGVFGRAVQNQLIGLEMANPRDFAADRHRTVDDKPYGGGAGMVLMYEPVVAAITSLRDAAAALGLRPRVVLLSPQGERFDQRVANAVAQSSQHEAGTIFVCGRYEGFDERIVDAVDAQWSLGDFVLSGGELAALAMMDAIARQVPGTLGNGLSKIDESHLDGWLDYPQYTRPEKSGGQAVPGELLSGDHGAVKHYRRRAAIARTLSQRPDLATGRVFSADDREIIRQVAAAATDCTPLQPDECD